MLHLEQKDTPILEIERTLRGMEDQVPFATAMTLTKTAKAVEKDVKEVMPKIFDRPTRYTINATFTEPAKKRDLEARVGLKDGLGIKGGNARDYLRPHIYGGQRKPKKSEKALRSRGHLGPNQFLVPGPGARLNKYGNIPGSQVQKALSHVRGTLTGDQDTTPGSAARNKRRGGRQYFWLPRTGIFYRQGRKLKAFLIVVDDVTYDDRWDFHGYAAQQARKELPGAMREALEKTIATARRKRG